MAEDHLDFDAWYRAAHPRLGASLTLAFRDPDLAQEAADEAFARAFANWNRVSSMDSPYGWLYKVGFNVARRRIRRSTFERRVLRRDSAPAHAPPADMELWHVVADLPPRQREAVVLRHVAQLREREVGEVMGLSRGGVSSTLRAAYEALRIEISETEPQVEVQ